jgi:hypothetical protein
MKVTTFCFVLFLFQSSFSSSAQGLTFFTGASLASMSDMKELQNAEAQQWPVQLKKTQTFPAYWQYAILMRWKIHERYRLGFHAFTTSTGARSTYEDYSGKITEDLALKCFGVAVHNEYLLEKKSRSEILGYLDTGYVFTWMNINNSILLGGNLSSQEDKYKSVNYLAEIGILYKYFINRISLEGKLGLQENLPGELINTNNGSKIYIGHNAKADWSGLKMMMGVGFNFSK